MKTTIDLDPVTRIEGHLAVRVEVAEGLVSEAFVSGLMFRGFEVILRGRDPLDAQQIMQRICGVCPIEHALASVFAQDQAYGVSVPENGRLLRNIIGAANYIQSHITHFYLLSAIDFIDVAGILGYNGNDAAMCELRAWAQSQLDSKVYLPAAPFLPRYETTYLQDKEANLGILRNYLESMNIRRLCHQMGASLAGRMPHVASVVPGGCTKKVDVDTIMSAQAYISQIREFVHRSYLPDVIAVASAFPAYWNYGRSPGNFLSYGAYPLPAGGPPRLLPRGVILGGKLEALDTGVIKEDVARSKFRGSEPLHPTVGETDPQSDKPDAYSWIKAPRYAGKVMEVGPMARFMVARAQNDPVITPLVDRALAAAGRSANDLNSVMGRHLARALEATLVIDAAEQWVGQLQPGQPTAARFDIPDAGVGEGLTEAARGSLGHWLEVKGRKVDRYQCVVPTTWNASPRDRGGAGGAIEQALVGTPVADEANPIEAVRVIRSFDPCLACAVH